MTTQPTALTAMRLMLMLEEAHGAGRVDADVFRELRDDYEALYRENGPLDRARASAASWEATAQEDMRRTQAGTCPAERMRATSTCLQHALSELGRWEGEATALKARLWAALARAATWTEESDEAADGATGAGALA
jgi:hypothetical protein